MGRILFGVALLTAAIAFGVDKTDSRLIGGQPADPKEWPASVRAFAGNSSCSATVAGARTVLIAAHCVGNGGTITFAAGGANYSARCAHHPEYSGNSTADWSLCYTNKDVTGFPYEIFGLEKKVAVGDQVRVTGYGCTRPGGSGGNDGIFRIGFANATAIPSSRNYDIVTRGGGALCYGDSGGSAYVEEGDDRFIVGVNSRGDISTTSYLPAVYATTFVNWAKSWAQSNNTVMCGIHASATNCRNVAPPPTPIDGGWSEWTAWSECKDAKQSRSRACTNPAPANGGKGCVGEKEETRACEMPPPPTPPKSDFPWWMVIAGASLLAVGFLVGLLLKK